MVDYIQPVSCIFSVAVNGQRFFIQNIVNTQGNQFFREVVGAVVIGAVGHNKRKAIRISVGAHQMIRGGLGSGIRRFWIIRCLFGEEAGFAQRPIDFVRGHMIKQMFSFSCREIPVLMIRV